MECTVTFQTWLIPGVMALSIVFFQDHIPNSFLAKGVHGQPKAVQKFFLGDHSVDSVIRISLETRKLGKCSVVFVLSYPALENYINIISNNHHSNSFSHLVCTQDDISLPLCRLNVSFTHCVIRD